MPHKLRNMLGYFLSSASSKLLAFLILPFVTYNLNPDEFGKWAIFNTTVLILIPLSGAVFRNALARSYYTSNYDQRRRKTYTILAANIALSLVNFLLIALLSLFFETLFGLNVTLYFFIPVLVLFNNFKEMGLLLMRYENDVGNYVKNEIGQGILNSLLILFFFLFVWVDWKSLLISYALALFVAATHALWFVKKQVSVNVSFDKKFIGECFTVGAHLLPHALSAAAISFSDRFILESKLGLEAVGVYSVAVSLAAVITMFTNAYNKVWGPWVTRLMSKDFGVEAKRLCVRYTYLFAILLSVYSALSILIIKVVISYLMPNAYHDAFLPFTFVVVGFMFQGLYFSFFHYLVFMKKTKIFLYATTLAALVNLTMNFLLVDKLGVIAAGISTSAAYFLLFFVIFLYNQHLNTFKWVTRRK